MPKACGCHRMCSSGVVVGIVCVCLPWRRLKDIRSGHIRRGDASRHAKNDPLLRTVRIHRPNDLAARIVEHLYLLPELIVRRLAVLVTEGIKRLVLFYCLAFVVIDLPAAYD